MITPNLINDNCTSLDGWTKEEGEWQVTGGGFHWRGSENGNLIPNPAVTWSGLTGTTEVRTQFITLDDHDNSTDFRLFWAINSSYLLDIFWCQDGVWTFDIAFEMNVKICDIDYTDTTWRIEFDSINGSCSFYKNGTLISTFNTPANAFVIPFFQFVGCKGTEGYILPNIKVGDGLGDFGYIPRNILRHRK